MGSRSNKSILRAHWSDPGGDVTEQPIGKELSGRAVIGRSLWSPELDGVYKYSSEAAANSVCLPCVCVRGSMRKT